MKTIVIATDFSEAALHAAQYAAFLSKQIPVSRLILYHSYCDLIATDTPLLDTRYYLQLQEDSMLKLTGLKWKIKPEVANRVVIDCIANMSSLRDAIAIDFVKENADLIVMGTTGKDKLKEKIFGSQAIIGARHTTIPLLLIPPNFTFKRIETIVLAWSMDNTEQIFPERTFNDILQQLKAELLILNIDHNNKHFSEATIREQEFMHHLVDAQHTSFFYDDHPDAARGIIDFAEERHADMVIIIPKKNKFPEGLFHKKVTKRLVSHIEIPLMVLPSKSTT